MERRVKLNKEFTFKRITPKERTTYADWYIRHWIKIVIVCMIIACIISYYASMRIIIGEYSITEGYKIRNGDTLSSIAKYTMPNIAANIGCKKIADLNKIDINEKLIPGNEIRVPARKKTDKSPVSNAIAEKK